MYVCARSGTCMCLRKIFFSFETGTHFRFLSSHRLVTERVPLKCKGEEGEGAWLLQFTVSVDPK